MVPRPVLHPVPLSIHQVDVQMTVFCAPVTTTVHIIDAQTGACYNPLGVNVSCDCVVGGPSVVVPLAYVNVTSSTLRPGLLRFCSALSDDIRKITAAVTGTLALVSVFSGGGAAQLQGMESLAQVDCYNNVKREVSVSLVPLRVGSDAPSGLIGLMIIITCAAAVHSLAVLAVYMLRMCNKHTSSKWKLGNTAGRLKYPALTVCAAQLAVAGTALESLHILVGSVGDKISDVVCGVAGLLAIVVFGTFVCVFAIKCSRIVSSCILRYTTVLNRYPLCLRRLLPSFCYDCREPLWCQWSFAFSTLRHRCFFVDCVDVCTTAIPLGAAAATTDTVCQAMSLIAAAVLMISASIVFMVNPYRRPIDRYCLCGMKVMNCLIAARHGLPRALGAIRQDLLSYVVMATVFLKLSYAVIIAVLEYCVWNRQGHQPPKVLCNLDSSPSPQMLSHADVLSISIIDIVEFDEDCARDIKVTGVSRSTITPQVAFQEVVSFDDESVATVKTPSVLSETCRGASVSDLILF